MDEDEEVEGETARHVIGVLGPVRVMSVLPVYRLSVCVVHHVVLAKRKDI